jgi:hypothetical protein
MDLLRAAKQRVIRLIYLKRFGRRWARPLADNWIWPLEGATVSTDGQLRIVGLDAPIAEPNGIGMALLKAVDSALNLKRRADAQFAVHNDHVEVTLDGINFECWSKFDIWTLHEIFAERLYAFEMPGPLVIVDIGVNIGSASLFFARHHDSKVHGFELVPSTARIAARNFARNPELAKRIELHDFGLSDSAGEFDIFVDATESPACSAANLPRRASLRRST